MRKIKVKDVLLLALLIILAMALAGCRSTRRTVNGKAVGRLDSTVVVYVEQSGVVDSFSRTKFSEWFGQEYERRMQTTWQTDREVVRETVVTETDTTGRVVRTENRTTARKSATQIDEVEVRLMTTYRRSMDSLVRRVDSLQTIVRALSHTEKADSVVVETVKEKEGVLFSSQKIIAGTVVVAFFLWFCWFLGKKGM